MSDLLGIGAAGVKAYGTALQTIGNNVSNANTPGYTRRTVTLSEIPPSGSTFGTTKSLNFNGVNATGVGRAWDDFKAATARSAASDAGAANAAYTWLSNAETALNDGATGVGQSATSFFTAGSALAADPTNTADRQVLLSSLSQTAAAFNSTASALSGVSQNIAGSAQNSVQQVNSDLDALDKVNEALKRTPTGSSGAADLMDQRDALIDDLASQTAISTTVNTDGSATVRLATSGTDLTGGARLAVIVGNNGALSVQASVQGHAESVANVGGALGGLVQASSIVADRRTSLDSMASDFVSAVNAWQANGKDANGAAGGPLLSGTSAATIATVTTDPSAVAAASADGTANGNVLALSDLRGSGGLEQRWSAMITDQGQVVSAANATNSAASSASDAANSARDDTTAVDLDTEAAQLIRYQQAYSGAAKVIQVAQDTMNSILQLF